MIEGEGLGIKNRTQDYLKKYYEEKGAANKIIWEEKPNSRKQTIKGDTLISDIIIKTDTGLILNDFIPNDYIFIHQENLPYYDIDWSSKTLALNCNSLDSAEYIAALSHEMGHAQGQGISNEISELIDAKKRGKLNTQEKKTNFISKFQMLKMRDELFAWDYGQLFNDVLGGDEVVYEEFRDRALRNYYYSSLIDTLKNINNLFSREERKGITINIYNPFIDKTEAFTYETLTDNKDKYIDELSKNNRTF